MTRKLTYRESGSKASSGIPPPGGAFRVGFEPVIPGRVEDANYGAQLRT